MPRYSSAPLILITGISSGIGYACAEAFLKEGYRVVGFSRREKAPVGARCIPCDLSSDQSTFDAVQILLRELGCPDLLLLNAGFGISGPIENCPPDKALQQFNVNYFGAVRVLNALLPHLREKAQSQTTHQPRICFISSAAAFFPLPYQAHYAASKAALTSLIRSLSMEVKKEGIKVCSLLPGDVSTGFTAQREHLEQLNVSSAYAGANRSISRMEQDEQKGRSASWVASKVLKICKKKHPPICFVPGMTYRLLYYLQKFLPQRLTDYLIRKLYT